MQQSLQILATNMITELFINHGIKAIQNENTIDFIDNNIKMEIYCFDHSQENHEQKSMQMDVILHYGLIPIVESFSGWGNDENAVLHDAVLNFTVATFHVLLSTFFTDKFDEQVEKETWQINHKNFVVTIGNMVSRGNVPTDLGTAWFDELQTQVQKLPLTNGVHWLRLYYGQAQSEVIAYEVLLNNEYCEPIMPLVENFSWQKSDDFYSMRVFLILQQGVDFGRVAYLIANSDSQDDAVEPLKNLGLSQLDAEKAVVFIPEAFGMVLMKQIGVQGDFPTTAQAVNQQEQTVKIDLTQETIFQQALQYAQNLLNNDYHTTLQELALMSAGMNILNNFLSDDENEPEQLNFADINMLFIIKSLQPVDAKTVQNKSSKLFW